MIEITEATTEDLISEAKALFQEYTASLNFDLCFQNFDREMADFPGQYAAPLGGLYLAYFEDQPVGCVGFRYFQRGVCEMKRLYVKPDFRGQQAGLKLAKAVITSAKIAGYRYIRLDTLLSMKNANRLYRSLGFVEIEPYRPNPIDGALYLELDLKMD
ncbi:MAG: GNAT family N-acetyltransferase [Desulfobacteraceae bacterium]